MTFLTVLRRNLLRRKIRTVLTLLAIIIAFTLCGLLMAIQRNFSSGADPASATRLISHNRISLSETLPLSHVGKIRALAGVKAASSVDMIGAYVRERKNLLPLLAVDPESYLRVYPEYHLDSSVRQAFLADRQSLLVGHTLAQRFALKKGDMVALSLIEPAQAGSASSLKLRVAGIFDSGSESSSGLALMHYERINTLRSLGKDRVSAIIIQGHSAKDNDQLIQQIDALFANDTNATSTSTEEAFNRALLAQLGNITLIVLLVVSAGLFYILLIIGSTMASAVRERTAEYGLFKTLGFTRNALLRLILSEGLLLTIVGGSIGLFVAKLISAALRLSGSAAFARVELTFAHLAVGLMLMVSFAIIATLFPALRAANISIATALSRRSI